MVSSRDACKLLYIKQLLGTLTAEDALAHPSFLVSTSEGYSLTPEARAHIRVAVAGGVFDILHPGHIHFLTEAKKHGDVLVVIVAHDETVLAMKGKKPVHEHTWRTFMVNALKPVDVALTGDPKDASKTLHRISPDVVVYGYDQQPIPAAAHLPSVRIQSHLDTNTFKSSKIKQRIKEIP